MQIRWHPVSIRAGTPDVRVLEVHFHAHPVTTRGGKLQICANVVKRRPSRFEDANPGKFCRATLRAGVRRRLARRPGAFAERPPPLLTPGLRSPLFAAKHCAARTGWPPGQPEHPPIFRLSWGQDDTESVVVVPVVRVVVVAVRRPAVDRVVVPTAPADHAVRASWPPPQICSRRASASPESQRDSISQPRVASSELPWV